MAEVTEGQTKSITESGDIEKGATESSDHDEESHLESDGAEQAETVANEGEGDARLSKNEQKRKKREQHWLMKKERIR